MMHWSDAGAASWYDVAVAVGGSGRIGAPRHARRFNRHHSGLPHPSGASGLSLRPHSHRTALDLHGEHWQQALKAVLQQAKHHEGPLSSTPNTKQHPNRLADQWFRPCLPPLDPWEIAAEFCHRRGRLHRWSRCADAAGEHGHRVQSDKWAMPATSSIEEVLSELGAPQAIGTSSAGGSDRCRRR